VACNPLSALPLTLLLLLPGSCFITFAHEAQNFLNRQTFVAAACLLIKCFYNSPPSPLAVLTPSSLESYLLAHIFGWIHLENLETANNILHYNIFTFNLAASVLYPSDPLLLPPPYSLPLIIVLVIVIPVAWSLLASQSMATSKMSVPLTKCLISVQESKKLLYGLLIAGGLFKAVGLLLYPSPLFPLLSHPIAKTSSSSLSNCCCLKRSLNVVTYFVKRLFTWASWQLAAKKPKPKPPRASRESHLPMRHV